jgi:hypothetical protein
VTEYPYALNTTSQNNVTDIPAAVAIGVVGAATTPLGQMVAKGVSGKVIPSQLTLNPKP